MWKDATVLLLSLVIAPTKRAAAIIILKFRVQNCEMGTLCFADFRVEIVPNSMHVQDKTLWVRRRVRKGNKLYQKNRDFVDGVLGSTTGTEKNAELKRSRVSGMRCLRRHF